MDKLFGCISAVKVYVLSSVPAPLFNPQLLIKFTARFTISSSFKAKLKERFPTLPCGYRVDSLDPLTFYVLCLL